MSKPNAHPSHDFEDVSYHGSPIWECRFCGLADWNPAIEFLCEKAAAVLAREAKKKEDEERWEYQRMKRERERWEYLRKKYEGA